MNNLKQILLCSATCVLGEHDLERGPSAFHVRNPPCVSSESGKHVFISDTLSRMTPRTLDLWVCVWGLSETGSLLGADQGVGCSGDIRSCLYLNIDVQPSLLCLSSSGCFLKSGATFKAVPVFPFKTHIQAKLVGGDISLSCSHRRCCCCMGSTKVTKNHSTKQGAKCAGIIQHVSISLWFPWKSSSPFLAPQPGRPLEQLKVLSDGV